MTRDDETDDEQTARDNPREATYRQYHNYVRTHAETALEALDEYDEDFNDEWDAVRYALDGAHWPNYGGLALVCNLMSHTDPDVPDYGVGWKQRVDLRDDDLAWFDVVGAMAWACLESDVMDRVRDELDDGGE